MEGVVIVIGIIAALEKPIVSVVDEYGASLLVIQRLPIREDT